MKKINLNIVKKTILLVLITIILTGTSCTKYEDGGYFSQTRFCKTWVLDSEINNLEITFEKKWKNKESIGGKIRSNNSELNNSEWSFTTLLRDENGLMMGTTSEKRKFMIIRLEGTQLTCDMYFSVEELTKSTLTLNLYYLLPHCVTIFQETGKHKFKAKNK